MPFIKQSDTTADEAYPGVPRRTLINAEHGGAQSLSLGHLVVNAGATIGTHIHPDTEEAMVITEGELEAVLGDETIAVGTGDTVLAPAGVKHGFVNRSSGQAALLAIFPQTEFQRVPVD